MLPDLHTGFSRGRLGGLVFPSLSEFSTVYCDLKVLLDTIKVLEENRTLSDINLSKIFFDPPPKVMKIKTKINKWNLIKLKSFYTTKETISKTKQNPQNRKYLQKM